MLARSRLDAFHQDKTLNLFEGIQPNQKIEITIQRGKDTSTISWVYPGFNTNEFLARFFNIWWMAYIFWFIGMCTQLFMRPKDTQWRLFVANSYLTGMFIILGSVSSFQVMGSAVFLRVISWLIFPAYIHFHWIFPKSFQRIPPWLKMVFYVVFGGIALAQLFSLLPNTLYLLAMALAFGGSVVLLACHYVLQPDHRREVRALVIASFISMFFVVLISLIIIGSQGHVPQSGPLSLLALPILPGTYFYILFRHSMGGLEFRANRAISLYAFLALLGTTLLLAVGYSGFANIPNETILFAVITTSLLVAFISIQVFPAFQSFVERRLLGIKLPAQNVVEGYSARIITSITMSGLLKLLEEEVFPSLFVRQYAFVRIVDRSTRILLSKNVTEDQVREDAIMGLLASPQTRYLIPSPNRDQPLDWVHLFIPLQIGSDVIGVWLLGRRDPDDLYPQAELPVLQSLANQTAVALSYIIQTERLKAMYAGNINRYEQERVNLAHDLHDSVLNEMAAMRMKLDPSSLPPEFQTSYDELINRVREIVGDLRPPMLLYGLKFALNGLADNLSGRNQDSVQIVPEIKAEDEWRYPEIVEHNIYRIMQEACENASKYARAKSIMITGELSSNKIDIKVADDGIGFRDEVSLQLDEMLANRHFGLAGMHERANLIGALIQIDSKPRQGTQIRILWEP